MAQAQGGQDLTSEEQTTFVMVKPDGVRRALTGEVIRRIEGKGLEIVAMRKLRMSLSQAQELYAPHEGKSFYEGLISFITSGPVVVMAVRGRKAIAAVRNLIGSTDPISASPGTIRGDFGLEVQENVVHASSSPEDATRELAIFFGADELAPQEVKS